jgi:hypothetical protein
LTFVKVIPVQLSKTKFPVDPDETYIFDDIWKLQWSYVSSYASKHFLSNKTVHRELVEYLIPDALRNHSRILAYSGWDMEGGAASGALPHCLFGSGLIFNSSFPPFAMSACENHGLPFSFADWI